MTASMFDGSLENYTNKENKPKKTKGNNVGYIYTRETGNMLYYNIIWKEVHAWKSHILAFSHLKQASLIVSETMIGEYFFPDGLIMELWPL